MPSLLQLLKNGDRAGVYRTTVEPGEIIAAAATIGLAVFRIDLRRARGKAGLLDQIAQALCFPAHFGKNWDALNDCLDDLEWLGKKDLLLLVTGAAEFADNYREDFDILVHLLEGNADSWRARKQLFWVLIQTPENLDLDLPQIVS